MRTLSLAPRLSGLPPHFLKGARNATAALLLTVAAPACASPKAEDSIYEFSGGSASAPATEGSGSLDSSGPSEATAAGSADGESGETTAYATDGTTGQDETGETTGQQDDSTTGTSLCDGPHEDYPFNSPYELNPGDPFLCGPGTPIQVQGETPEVLGDEQWYRLDYAWQPMAGVCDLATVSAVVDTENSEAVDVCVYARCAQGPTSLATCPGSLIESDNLPGFPGSQGCCGTSGDQQEVSVPVGCNPDSSAEANAYVVVSSPSGACVDYTLAVHAAPSI